MQKPANVSYSTNGITRLALAQLPVSYRKCTFALFVQLEQINVEWSILSLNNIPYVLGKTGADTRKNREELFKCFSSVGELTRVSYTVFAIFFRKSAREEGARGKQKRQNARGKWYYFSTALAWKNTTPLYCELYYCSLFSGVAT